MRVMRRRAISPSSETDATIAEPPWDPPYTSKFSFITRFLGWSSYEESAVIWSRLAWLLAVKLLGFRGSESLYSAGIAARASDFTTDIYSVYRIYLVANAGLNDAPKLSLGFCCANILGARIPLPAADSKAWAYCVDGKGVDAHEPVD